MASVCCMPLRCYDGDDDDGGDDDNDDLCIGYVTCSAFCIEV
jgi:hypothetical protein